jgi:hypothetical protein
MNTARANDVLRMIDDAASDIESRAERLALLLAEARREKYWTLRGFKCERNWLLATFPDCSLSYVRQLAVIGQAYEGEIGVLGEIGMAKANAIQRLPHRDNWIHRAKSLSLDQLQREIKAACSRIKTPRQAKDRILRLRLKVESLKRQIEDIEAEISALEEKWRGVTDQECSDVVCEETRRRWMKENSDALPAL